MKRKLIYSIYALIVLLCLFPQEISAQQLEHRFQILFRQAEHTIDSTCSTDTQILCQIKDFFNKIDKKNIDFISIYTTSSLEGSSIYNKKLSKRRSDAIYNYLTSNYSIPNSLLKVKYKGVDWDMLIDKLQTSKVPYKNEVIEIIRTIPEETWRKVNPTDKWMTMVDSRNKHLMDLRYGIPYKAMESEIFPSMRQSTMLVVHTHTDSQADIAEDTVEIVEQEKTKEIAKEFTEEVKSKECILITEENTSTIDDSQSTTKKPLFALKTNLLFDIATMLNVEVEVPIGNRWSIAGEWIFPWWTLDNGQSDSKRHRLQLLQGNLMGKYWFGDRTDREVMTGWFAGIYAGAGLYDFEYDRKGIQGEFFIAGGLAGGYAHTINKKGNLRMEYSLGLGYLSTDYRQYKAEYYGENDWKAIREKTGKRTWIGPTQAKVSLVWMIK